jgi:hypothetical protein
MKFVKVIFRTIVYLFALWGLVSATFVGMLEYGAHRTRVEYEQQHKIWGH